MERLIAECYKTTEGEKIVKTKTASLIPIVTSETYTRRPDYAVLNTTKRETRTIMMARYGLLECGRNFKGTHSEICIMCSCIDDEHHRLNECVKWKSTNLYLRSDKTRFSDVYSNDIEKIRSVLTHVTQIWDTNNAHGTMVV